MCITIIENADKQLQSGELGILKLGKSEDTYKYAQWASVDLSTLILPQTL